MSKAYHRQAQDAASRYEIGVAAAAIARFANSIAADVQRISSMPIYPVTADDELVLAQRALAEASEAIKQARIDLGNKPAERVAA